MSVGKHAMKTDDSHLENASGVDSKGKTSATGKGCITKCLSGGASRRVPAAVVDRSDALAARADGRGSPRAGWRINPEKVTPSQPLPRNGFQPKKAVTSGNL